METSLQQLFEARERLVPFVGTGVSIQASGNPDATWPGLLQSGIEECATFCPDLPPGWRSSMLDRLENADHFSYLAIADELHRRLDAENHYEAWIRRVVKAIELVDDSVLTHLVELSTLLVTTNYDSLIEDALIRRGRAPKKIESGDLDSFAEAADGSATTVLYLHGSVTGDIVLSPSQYQSISLDSAIQMLQTAVTATKQLLFVGVGEGLHDPNIGRALNDLTGKRSKERAPHFLLVRGCELSEARRRNRSRPIVPIAYGDDYDDLGPFLAALAVGKIREVPQEPSSTSAESQPLRIGSLNIAAFAEERIEDLLEVVRRSRRALEQVQSRIDLPAGFDRKRPSDQLTILQQQVASIHGPIVRLTRSTATISHCSEATEAELSKIAADRRSLDGFTSIMDELVVASEQLQLLLSLAGDVSETVGSRVSACQDFSECSDTLLLVATTVGDSAEEISGLIDQLQDPDEPSIADRLS